MNLFVGISDVHISLKNLDVSITVLTQALNRARDLRIPLFIAGDLNDGKAIMRSEWVKALIDLFHAYSDVQIYVLIGNHDLDNKNSDSNSLYFLKTLSNVILIDRPAVFAFGEACNPEDRLTEFGVIPYQHSNEAFLQELDVMKGRGIKNIIIHQGILSAHMGDYVVDESSVNPEVFKSFDIVLSGHYHRQQKVAIPNWDKTTIMYFGSPFTVNFGEANETKFIWVVEINAVGEVYPKPELTSVRRHCQIEWTSAEANPGVDPAVGQHVPDGSLLKVVVRGTKEFVRSQSLEGFQKRFPQCTSISIVPEIDKQSENRISADIIHSPLKVIDVYLDQCNTTFDKSMLKDFLLHKCKDIFEKYSSVSSKKFTLIGVEGDNFLSFKHMNYDYKPMGLTLVEGYDDDLGVNTGAGKSTFLDFPVYGIFGETSKSLKADEILHRPHPKDTKVLTRLQGDDGVYTVCRYRKHKEKENDLYLLLPNGQEVRGKDNRETQKIIEQTIGCSFDVFLKSSYFTQFGSIDRFLSSSDTEKKNLISEITDLSIYDEMCDAVKKSIAADEKILTDIGNEIAKIESNVNMMKNQRDNNQARINVWNSDHIDKLRNLEIHASHFEVQKQAKMDELNKEFATWNMNQQLKVKDLEVRASKFDEDVLEKITTNNEKIHIYNGDIAGIEFQIKELEQFPIVSVAEEKKKIQDKLDIIRQLEDKNIKLTSERYHKQNERMKIKAKMDAELAKLAEGAPSDCLFCHQTVSADHIHKHVAVFEIDYNKLTGEVGDLNGKIHAIEQSVKIKGDLQKQLADLDATDKKQYEIKYKIDLHNRSINSIKSNIESLAQANAVVHQNPYTESIKAAQQVVNPVQAKIDMLSTSVNNFEAELTTCKLSTNPYLEVLKETEAKIQTLLQHQTAEEDKMEVYRLSQGIGNWWKVAIHVYIKSYLMDSCLESINTIANEHLSTLFDGVLKFDISATTEKGSEVKEKINVSIINNGDECSYQSLSGGERCRICLAVNLSLAEVINKNFGMIFFDEILNGLDEAGKSQSMKLLKDLERKYPSIFVIDHAEGFKNLFTNSIMIKKKNKVSAIV